jgi:hypothetical protein
VPDGVGAIWGVDVCDDQTVSTVRFGLQPWVPIVAEAVLCEIVAGFVRRRPDQRSGLSLLDFD